MKTKLRIPETLAVMVVAAGLSSCGSDPNVQQAQNVCPPDYYCSTDAARAFNCTDMSPSVFQSDFGICSPPV
jgi:hypothetical protein